MSNISMVEAKLPAGFRFHPKDEELVCDYLMNKVTSSDSTLLIEVDLNKCEPWNIPEAASVGRKEWYFYSKRDRKYATGLRTNRATLCGYWKATGKDRPVLRKGTLYGMRKTLVFYHGRAPKGKKSDWVMHEFRLQGPFIPPIVSSLKEDWVLCRMFNKNTEIESKPSMESYSSSSSLPPLTDSIISFDQTLTLTNNNNIPQEYEQVPCFSIFCHNNQNQTFSHITQLDSNIPTSFGPILPESGACFNQFSSENNKVIKAVLNHLNKMETNDLDFKESSSFGEASFESYLSDVGMPNLWKNYES